MNKYQLKNLFYFLSIMKYDNILLSTSPDYLSEKSLSFFNKLGNKNFVPNIRNEKFWIAYCKFWNIEENNYEILNIINFISMSYLSNSKNVIKNFKIFIGDVKYISDYDLSYKVHKKILDHINNIISNDRYLKLLSLN